MAQVNIRIDDNTKEQAEKFFDAVGLTMSSAINLFLHQVVLQHELPFRIKEKTVTNVNNLVDPFEISPSGDPYFSHPENIAKLKKSIEESKHRRTVVKTFKELEQMANG
jgi:DNA-damage-inducible protein J